LDLGNCFYSGQGREKNSEKGMQCYKLSKKVPHPKSEDLQRRVKLKISFAEVEGLIGLEYALEKYQNSKKCFEEDTLQSLQKQIAYFFPIACKNAIHTKKCLPELKSVCNDVRMTPVFFNLAAEAFQGNEESLKALGYFTLLDTLNQ
jgi:hypothetical protein